MDTKKIVKEQYEEHLRVVKENPELYLHVAEAASLIIDAFKAGKRLYACGNGGSTCDAMHLVEEIVAQYKNKRPPLPAHHLMDPSVITCWSNDEGYDDVFRRQVEAYGREGDVFIGISTSGNSPNVIRALDEARKKGMKTISFLGKDGGKMKGKADVDIIVTSGTTARIQEMHIFAIHSILECIDTIIHGV